MEGTFRDVIGLVDAVAWPLVTLVVVLGFRKEIPRLLQALGGRISGFAAAGVSIELAAAEPPAETLRLLDQIREPSSTGPPPPSNVKSLLELARSSPRCDYLVIDLRAGREWITSRLYLFSLILPPLLGLRCFVFVGTRGSVPRSFLGLTAPDAVARALEKRSPWLRRAMVRAQLKPLLAGDPQARHTAWSPYGDSEKILKRLAGPGAGGPWDVARGEALDELVRALVEPFDPFQPGAVERFVNQFLENPGLRRAHEAEAEDRGWVRLGSVDERAEYIEDERGLLDLLGDALRRERAVDEAASEEEALVRAVLRRRGDFVAVTDAEGRFERLIDRVALLEKAATGKRR